MKKHFLIASFVLLTLTTLNSCKKDSASTDSDCVNTTQWIKDGHKFSYKNFPLLFPGDSVFLEIKEFSPIVFQSINKTSLYTLSSSYIQPCGNIAYESTVSSMANKQISLKLDGDIGESWAVSAQSGQGYGATLTTTIKEKNVMVTVPAGTFACVKYTTVVVSSNPSTPTTSVDSYYNSKYGLIKIIGLYTHYELAKANY